MKKNQKKLSLSKNSLKKNPVQTDVKAGATALCKPKTGGCPGLGGGIGFCDDMTLPPE